MFTKHCRKIVLAAVFLSLAVVAQTQAQRFGGGGRIGGLGGGFHPSMGAMNFGGGSVVHRDFSPPAGISRPAMPQNFQRPNIPNVPQHLNLPDRIGGGGDWNNPGLPGNIRPGQGGAGERHIPTARDGGPDWKNWKDFDPKQINGSVIDKVRPNDTMINDVRNNFNKQNPGSDIWSKNWFDKHPDAWHPGGGEGPQPGPKPGPGPGPHPEPAPGPHPGPGPHPPGPPGPHPPGPPGPYPPGPAFWWGHPGWDYAWGWFGAGFFAGAVTDAILNPIPYDYGSNVVYTGDTVYVNNVPYVSAEEYYQQAQDLANSGADAAASDATPDNADQWMSMGTFAVVADGKQTESKRILQIATSKKGQIRGNLVDTETDKSIELYGSVDPKTQRVAFKLKGNDDVVAECGLWNLTQETVPMLVHVNRDKTEERTLIRLKNDGAGSQTETKTTDTETVAP